jgi:ankyrin repeat protein
MKKLVLSLLTLAFCLPLVAYTPVTDCTDCPPTTTVAEPTLTQAQLNAQLFAAVQAGSLAQVKSLIAQGADVNWQNPDLYLQTPAFPASYGPHPDILQVLISNGAAVNQQDIDLESPLHRAAHYGHVSTAQILLDAGADPNQKDKWGNTCMKTAVDKGNTAVVTLMQKYGGMMPKAGAGSSGGGSRGR